jgi:hypothetical protein
VVLHADVDFFNFLGSEVPSFHIVRSSSYHQQIVAVLEAAAAGYGFQYGAIPGHSPGNDPRAGKSIHGMSKNRSQVEIGCLRLDCASNPDTNVSELSPLYHFIFLPLSRR